MEKSKTRSKSTVLSVALIIVSLIVIVATTLAYFTDRVSKESTMQFGKISIAEGKGFVSGSTSLKDKLPGDKITDTISFSKSVDSQPMYVRAKVSFTTNGNDTVKAYVKELNNGTFAIKEYTTSNYKWSEKMGNYYYLMDMTGDKVHTLSTNEEITLADSLVLSIDLKQDEEKSQYMQEISLSVEIQAIQTANISNDFDTVNTKFGEVFGEKAEIQASVIREGMKFGQYTSDNTNNTELVGKYYVSYGYYPQSKATTEETTALADIISVKQANYTFENSTTMMFDVYEYNGKEFVKNGDNFYKVEPVKWIILGYGDDTALTDGDITAIAETSISFSADAQIKADQYGLLVLSEKMLTKAQYDPYDTSLNRTQYNEYSKGSLVQTMSSLVNQIFTNAEKSVVKPQTLYSTYFRTYADASTGTGDKVSDALLFPLAFTGDSYKDNFGVQTYLTTTNSRISYISAFANNGTESASFSGWLRSGYFDNPTGVNLTKGKGFGIGGSNVNDSNGVRLAFVMNLA